MNQSPGGELGRPLYLRSSLIAIRYERERHVLFHPGSNSVMATDWLGAHAARLMLHGYSDADVACQVERQAEGAGKRLRSLTRRLVTIGAMSNEPPRRSVRWHARDVGSLALGWLLSIASSLLRIAPLWALHLLYEALPETPLGTRALGQSLAWIESNLRESGFADAAPQRRAEIARGSVAVSTRLFFFVYLCGLLPSERFERFERFMLCVIDVAGFEALGRQVGQSGAVIATVHSDLFFSVPIYLMARGMPVSCVADRFVLGAALASDRDIRETFPTLFPAMLDSRGLTTGKELLMRLRRGEVVGVAFDAQPQREALGEAMPRIPFLGREVRRFDGAAWLGVRAGKPLLFISTYRHGKRTVPQVTLLRADASRPIREQVAALTAQMYALGEACIREHPESWMVWSYFHELGPVCA